MALLTKQITVSQNDPRSNPVGRDYYLVKEIQGAVNFNTPTKTDVRVGDTITFQEIYDYLTGPGVDVLIIVTE